MINITIAFDNKEYNVKPSFDVVEKIEQKFSLIEFMNTVSAGDMKISSVAWVIFSALSMNGYRVEYREIGAAVTKALLDSALVAAEIINAILGVGPEKEVKKNQTAEQ